MSIPIRVATLPKVKITITLRFFLRVIVFLIHVSVGNIFVKFLVYDVQD